MALMLRDFTDASSRFLARGKEETIAIFSFSKAKKLVPCSQHYHHSMPEKFYLG